jgi:hypothetical protein
VADYLTSITAIRDNLVAEVLAETAQRVADQAAGLGVKTSYSAGGRSVDWNAYVSMMTDQITKLNAAIVGADAFEIPTIAVPSDW